MQRGWTGGHPASTWTGVALLAAALAWDTSGFDMAFAHLAGSAQGFPWRDDWLLVEVLHEGGRRLAWLLELALCLAVWWPFGPLARLDQRARLQLALSTLLGALAVILLKNASHTSCPWELADFGGIARHVSHWSRAIDGGTGRCFPAGHAAAGFTFMGGYFAFRPTEPRTARTWLLAAFGSGLVLGVAQQWRGAHFMSHTLWTAVVCWLAGWYVDAAWARIARQAG
jgi:membrane-associated PAP2 superfamily phosphatase